MTTIFRNNSFKTFFLKLFIFFTLIFLADLIVGKVLKRFYFKQESGYSYETTFAINKTNADIVIFGSSRAANLLDPDIFENHFNLSCFNAGRLGYPIFYHYAVLKCVINRYTPKIVILSFDAGNFSIKQSDYDKLSSLLPYYNDHPEIRPIISLKDPYEKLKMTSAIYPFNSMLLPIISGNSAFSKNKFATVKGYVPLKRVVSGPVKKVDYTLETKLDTVKINVYKSFLKACIELNIKLYVVCPPYLVDPVGTDLSITTAKKIAEDFKVDFFDFSRDTFYTNQPHLFADFRHLNEKGAGLYSNDVAERINSHSQSTTPIIPDVNKEGN